MVPFCWLGRVLNGAFERDTLTIRIWLRDPIPALTGPAAKAVPAPLGISHVDGRLVCASVTKSKAAIKASFGKVKSPRPAVVPAIHDASTRSILDGWSKASPWDRFFVNVEAWLVQLHDQHPIAVATVDWYDWFGRHARPEPCAWHRDSLAAIPDLATLAGVIDDENTPASHERRDLATAILYFASDHRPLYARVADDDALQTLYARAWSTDERGRTLQLLASVVDDDTLAKVASRSARLRAVVLGRGLSAADCWNVWAMSTPANDVWGIQERKRLFYLSRPMRPHMVFDQPRGFVVTEPDWGIDEADDVPGSDVALGAAFASRYGRLVERGEPPGSPGDEAFVARARTDIARVLTGTVANHQFTWVDAG